MIDEATIAGAMVRRHASGERTRARILVAMLGLGGPASLRRIGDAAGCSFMTVKHHTATMLADGLVTRGADGLSLTAAGIASAKLIDRGA